MKKNMGFFAAVFVLALNSVSAQSTYKEEVDAAQAIFGIQKKDVVSKLIKMTAADSAKFWPLYDAYEVERKLLGQQRLQLLNDMADAYQQMTLAKADDIVSRTQKLSAQNDKLLGTYYNKIKKVTSSTIAFEFYEAEIFILTEIRSELMGQIPLYSEVKPK